ncbi:MAG: SGNH/GDSL hydrolase family protein, partial [Deltaproteobacteria bacterium]|nr:SGNH/GDSL hydrolase family protein [Deltaproteobacteria bacterium]
MSRGLRGGLVALLCLAALEIASRSSPAPSMVTVPEAAEGGDTLMNGNPWLLWELVPGVYREKGGHVTVNRSGLRDRERGPRSRPRALAVGDSSVYGFGNDDDEVFTSILESRLPADFVNAAVPGYSTFQVINQLRGRTLALDPDLLLVATLWSDNNFDSFSDKDLLASYAGWTDS